MGSGLKTVLSEALLRRLAGTKSFERGEAYFRRRTLSSLRVTAGAASAIVAGSQDYEVDLRLVGGRLESSCDCPMGDGGAFCKHLVALGLAVLGGKQAGKVVDVITDQDVVRAFAGEAPEKLAAMLLQWTEDDERLKERLWQFAAGKKGPGAAIGVAQDALRNALRIRGHVDYREVRAWAARVGAAVEQVASLMELKEYAGVIELCEEGLVELEKAATELDDSDGYISIVREELQELHFAACEKGKPDRAALARRLFAFELNSDLDLFWSAAEKYNKILGKEGMRVYRELAEKEWAKVPVRMGKKHFRESLDYFRITSIMKALARASGDVEQMVAVLSRDLTSGYRYLEIAEAYRAAGKIEKAVEWAERGLKDFAQEPDSRLRDFLAAEYAATKRFDDALELAWKNFAERVQLGNYLGLLDYARKAGVLEKWRQRALDYIRVKLGGGQRDLLVQIALHERDVEWAWREANEGGCYDSMWLTLAEERAKTHPDQAGMVFLRVAERSIARVTNARYEEGVRLLVAAASMMREANQSAAFVAELERLKLKFKAKRKLMQLLDAKRGDLYGKR